MNIWNTFRITIESKEDKIEINGQIEGNVLFSKLEGKVDFSRIIECVKEYLFISKAQEHNDTLFKRHLILYDGNYDCFGQQITELVRSNINDEKVSIIDLINSIDSSCEDYEDLCRHSIWMHVFESERSEYTIKSIEEGIFTDGDGFDYGSFSGRRIDFVDGTIEISVPDYATEKYQNIFEALGEFEIEHDLCLSIYSNMKSPSYRFKDLLDEYKTEMSEILKDDNKEDIETILDLFPKVPTNMF